MAMCVQNNSNGFRPKFVGRAEFPPPPPRPPHLSALGGEATLSDWTISSFSLAANYYVKKDEH